MTRKAGIVGLIATCLVLAGVGAFALAEATATPSVEFRTQLEQLLHALESGDTDAVQRAASVLPDQSRRTGWNTAAIAISDEARRLCNDGQGPADAHWQRLVAVCRQLLSETSGEPEHEALRKRTLAETRKALTEVLAAPEYHGTTAPSWWQRYGIRALEALRRWLERIFSTHLGRRAGVVA